MSAPAAVSLESVSKHFPTRSGAVRALDGVTLSVPPGASLAITGPSGCGKSTLLSLVGALESPTHGRVVVGEHVVSELPESQRARLRRSLIGFVFQSDNLLPFLTAAENVSLALSLRSQEGGWERPLELLGRLGLAHAADKYPDELSGGERQRVAVARAVAHRPSLILADEPTGSLDAVNAQSVIEMLLAAQAEVGATMIVITHDPAIADRLEHQTRLRDGVVAEPSSVPR